MENKILNNEEEVFASYKNVIVFANDNEHKFPELLITNQRIIFLKDGRKEYDYVGTYPGRGITTNEILEVFADIKISDIKDLDYSDGMNHVILKDENVVDIVGDSIIALIV